MSLQNRRAVLSDAVAHRTPSPTATTSSAAPNKSTHVAGVVICRSPAQAPANLNSRKSLSIRAKSNAHHERVLNRTRSRADRALTLAVTSSCPACTARFVSSSKGAMRVICPVTGCCVSALQARKWVLTARSSREWKLMTASRPPGANAAVPSLNKSPSADSSSFTTMRSAWNTCNGRCMHETWEHLGQICNLSDLR